MPVVQSYLAFGIFASAEKCRGKEECEVSGLSGQISNFLTLFLMLAKICQAATKQEIIITIENVCFFRVVAV